MNKRFFNITLALSWWVSITLKPYTTNSQQTGLDVQWMDVAQKGWCELGKVIKSQWWNPRQWVNCMITDFLPCWDNKLCNLVLLPLFKVDNELGGILFTADDGVCFDITQNCDGGRQKACQNRDLLWMCLTVHQAEIITQWGEQPCGEEAVC